MMWIHKRRTVQEGVLLSIVGLPVEDWGAWVLRPLAGKQVVQHARGLGDLAQVHRGSSSEVPLSLSFLGCLRPLHRLLPSFGLFLLEFGQGWPIWLHCHICVVALGGASLGQVIDVICEAQLAVR